MLLAHRRHPMLAPAALLSLSLLLAAGCSSTAATDDGSSSGTVDSGARDAAVDATDAATPDAPINTGYLACMDSQGHVSASLKSCAKDGDCVIQNEKVNCCGLILYVGVSTTSAAAFAPCEAAWESNFPACGCDSGQTTTEDGKSVGPGTGNDAQAPGVRCESGLCKTYFPG